MTATHFQLKYIAIEKYNFFYRKTLAIVHNGKLPENNNNSHFYTFSFFFFQYERAITDRKWRLYGNLFHWLTFLHRLNGINKRCQCRSTDAFLFQFWDYCNIPILFWERSGPSVSRSVLSSQLLCQVYILSFWNNLF